MSGYLNQPR